MLSGGQGVNSFQVKGLGFESRFVTFLINFKILSELDKTLAYLQADLQETFEIL